MGREIRRVPPGWKHPKNERGYFIPLFDGDFESEAKEWDANNLLWEKGEHPDQKAYPESTPGSFEDWDGERPCPGDYRPAWSEESATAYQIYDPVTEGTPTSPVFDTLGDLEVWLVEQGYSEHAAHEFAREGWAPSMVMHFSASGVTIKNDIHSFDID